MELQRRLGTSLLQLDRLPGSQPSYENLALRRYPERFVGRACERKELLVSSAVAVAPVVTHISSDSNPRFAVDPRSRPFQLSGQSEEHSVFAEST